ncbi:sigma-70 family RNA polymerase sigma factor [Luteipulveratus mongoliensis]|uniref:RNA polymerase sigma24 factor n=1 Tax=Luteipulveratus mongoliensis TaxID=571913 RepID=A0A0K1JD86_9MICO|nr:sigma-70 family RNA polymerase sigma factor [Luteipulveratus mongoliensis]AKU14664.1 hypothetical protein VV02_00225 [Luteipulveratus mongoliensis]
MDEGQERAYREFAAGAIPHLHRVAYGASRDRHRADDLVQTTLEKMYVAWPRVGRTASSPLAYARKVLVRILIDEQRRAWFRREVSVDAVPEQPAYDGRLRSVEDTPELVAALARLSQRQRLAVLLRHVEGLSVAEVSESMGISESNVKAATREGLGVLREVWGASELAKGAAS